MQFTLLRVGRLDGGLVNHLDFGAAKTLCCRPRRSRVLLIKWFAKGQILQPVPEPKKLIAHDADPQERQRCHRNCDGHVFHGARPKERWLSLAAHKSIKAG